MSNPVTRTSVSIHCCDRIGVTAAVPCTPQVRGVVLLNGAGKFEGEEEGGSPLESTDEVSVTPTGEVKQKVRLYSSTL